jgi:hypothetical protein
MVRDKDFGKLAAIERARGHREGEPLALDRERGRAASVREASAGTHLRTRLSNAAHVRHGSSTSGSA